MGSKSTFTFVGQDKVTPELQKINKSLNQFETNFKGLAETFKAVGGAFLVTKGFDLLTGGLTEASQKFLDFQKSSLTLQAQFKTAATNLGLTFTELTNQANELEGATGIDDQEIMASMSLLQTFSNVRGEVFQKAIVQATNLASKFGSIELATKQLGDALNDPIGGLAKLDKAQITFTENEKKHYEQLVATGNLYEAQNLILDKVAAKYDKVAESINVGPNASINALGNAWDDSMKNFGQAAVEFALPVIDQLTSRLNLLNAQVTIGGKTAFQNRTIGLLSSLASARVSSAGDKKLRDATIQEQYRALEDSGFNMNAYLGALKLKSEETQKVLDNLAKSGADKATINSWKEEKEIYDAQIVKLNQIAAAFGTISDAKKKAQEEANLNAKGLVSGAGTDGQIDFRGLVDSTNNAEGFFTTLTLQASIDQQKAIEEIVAKWDQANVSASEYEETLKGATAQSQKFIEVSDWDTYVLGLSNAVKGIETFVEKWQTAIGAVSKVFQTFNQIQDQYAQQQLEANETQYTQWESAERDKLARAKANGTYSTQMELDFLDQKMKKEDELREAQRQYKIREFNANRTASMGNVVFETAVNVAKNLSNPILAGIVAAAGLAQIALIMGQPMPAFANGGVVPGNSFSGDRILARVNSGEMLLNSRQQSNLFDAINRGSGMGTHIVIQVTGDIIGDTSDQLATNIHRRIRSLQTEGRIAS